MGDGQFPGEFCHGRAVQLRKLRSGDLNTGRSCEFFAPVRRKDQISEIVRIYILIEVRALPVYIAIDRTVGALNVLDDFGLVCTCRVVYQIACISLISVILII